MSKACLVSPVQQNLGQWWRTGQQIVAANEYPCIGWRSLRLDFFVWKNERITLVISNLLQYFPWSFFEEWWVDLGRLPGMTKGLVSLCTEMRGGSGWSLKLLSFPCSFCSGWWLDLGILPGKAWSLFSGTPTHIGVSKWRLCWHFLSPSILDIWIIILLQ